jgi:hypothetical protein
VAGAAPITSGGAAVGRPDRGRGRDRLGRALGLRVGGGETLRTGRLVRLAVGLALGAVVLGQVGLWLYARTEGGVLGPLEYLGETFGLLVPLELAAASIAAWLTAR